MTAFSSFLAGHLEAYVKLQRALGYQFEYQTSQLYALDDFLLPRGDTESMTQEIAIAFCATALDRSGLIA